LLGIRDASDPELAVRPEDVELCDLTSMASAHLENGRIAQAVQAYRRVLERFPNDRPSQIMLEAISASEFA
jgi:cytochrome c-type biogenesis protein CcmH/NrfG